MDLPCPAPAIRTKADVVLYEQHDAVTSQFLRSLFVHFDSDDYVWIGVNAERRKQDLTIQDLVKGLRQMPDDKAFPELPPNITPAPAVDLGKCFIKRPQVYHLLDKDVAPLVPQILLDEAKTLEILKENPHPDIVPYFGCSVKRGRITGIVLRRYHSVLDRRFLSDASEFDVEVFKEALNAALQHIHGLGLAHNDINPSNIALDANDRPVIIDWGSCKHFGAELLSAGTPGWIEDDFDISKQDHDVTAVEKVLQWVRQEKERWSK
ncbi:hypothetical protein CERZMDRAFT_45687 [Cercospora zeae-maydis SCOH1-5]|uniref:Protein kinase domain-containing protein n=1 Tax=Cercospora zeae-maydis SCOH1-5 TaxID=717836 RepID=A0A6A6FA38_9PEZI|nr:hypothetical protein CERZMDRAFT_45687 [Cercospora zeae-maydis SCOH1-5]